MSTQASVQAGRHSLNSGWWILAETTSGTADLHQVHSCTVFSVLTAAKPSWH